MEGCYAEAVILFRQLVGVRIEERPARESALLHFFEDEPQLLEARILGCIVGLLSPINVAPEEKMPACLKPFARAIEVLGQAAEVVLGDSREEQDVAAARG